MVKLQSLHKEILLKKDILSQTKNRLKAEFIGIDQVIDEVIDNISSWYFFPTLQSKPVIINLWGLTGVGKSSLVKRIAELISFKEKYYQFDLGASKEKDWEMKNKLENIYENVNGYPVIIALDEFQHARTLNENRDEMDKSSSRVIWELLDSGQFQVTRNFYRMEEVYHLMLKLKFLLAKGVIVKDGRVVAKKEFFIKEMGLTNTYQQYNQGKEVLRLENVSFISHEDHHSIYSIAKEKFTSSLDVKLQLNKLDGNKTIEFLEKVFEFATSPKTVDCSKALIFVLGNLDEAYTMSNNYNPDMNADEFHEQTLKINLTQIKSALRHRFRNEQIARLGNIHIIYPAFNSQSFHKIIKLELTRIQENVWLQQNIKISFDESICELIYKEGVYPTQGTRPIFTTIHQVINTKLGRVLTELIINKLNSTKIFFRAEGNIVTVDYFNRKNLIYSFSEKQVLNLERLRKNRKDDMQAITAVHECGHAIIAIILLKTVPEVIYSVTADTDSYGFVHTKFHRKYISKEQIVKRIAMYFGGYVAEKIVFGEDNITAGAEEDITRATSFATTMLKSCGMGSIAASFQVKDSITNNFIHDENNLMNKESQELIQNALSIAENILKEQQTLLLKMSDYLCDNRCMNKETIKEMIRNYAECFNENELIENGDFLFYRKHLKEKILEISNTVNKTLNNTSNIFEVSLNKVKDEY